MGRKQVPGLILRAGVYHIEKRLFGRRVCQSTGTSRAHTRRRARRRKLCQPHARSPTKLWKILREQRKVGGAISRRNLRPRAKGQPSLNPGGRPKKESQLAEMAGQHAIAALAALVDVMQDKTATPASRVSAASEILDRAFGRAPQAMKLNVEASFSEQFEAFVREINARTIGAPGSSAIS